MVPQLGHCGLEQLVLLIPGHSKGIIRKLQRQWDPLGDTLLSVIFFLCKPFKRKEKDNYAPNSVSQLWPWVHQKELGQAFPFRFIGQLPYISSAAGVQGSVSQAQYLVIQQAFQAVPRHCCEFLAKKNTRQWMKNKVLFSLLCRL
ncbi:hypothetical protein AV530_002328 [Patagioenas fasciata monilis]|uniref:Uncharacterized protein n=1 Tax=Patagioenas fasciata monilis TaxID=372326 RepID=A0A1V4K5X6_PATFA|nr:hypothetical protein AV530_002328 [Patagioenas fasciata monilis]